MKKFKKDDVCVINSKASKNNGKAVIVLDYAQGRCDDMVIVTLMFTPDNEEHKFLIRESSLIPATKGDVLRSAPNYKLAELLITIKTIKIEGVGPDIRYCDLCGRSHANIENAIASNKNHLDSETRII